MLDVGLWTLCLGREMVICGGALAGKLPEPYVSFTTEYPEPYLALRRRSATYVRSTLYEIDCARAGKVAACFLLLHLLLFHPSSFAP